MAAHRVTLFLLGASLTLVACDSGQQPGPMLRVPLGAFAAEHFCFDVTVTQPSRSERQTTCGLSTQPTELSFACTEPARVAMVSVPKTPDAGAFTSPCPATSPCVVDAPCTPDADTLLAYELVIMPNTDQGFFDIEVNLDLPPRGLGPLGPNDVADFCVDFAVHGPSDDLLWSVDGICASAFGNGAHTLTYIGVCDSSDGGANELEVTLVGATNSDGLALEGIRLPCADGAVCTIQATCEKNSDVAIRLAP